MGNLHTPLTNTPVVDWTDTAVGPDVPQSMMNALGSLERYANVPVPDAPTRETLMPTAQRYVGQVTYNVATDTFEYWNGTKWNALNRAATLPGTIHTMSYPGVVLQPNAYYDYRVAVNITSPCVVVIWGKIGGYTNIGPGQWGGLLIQMLHNEGVWANHGGVNAFYPASYGGGQLDLGSWGRWVCDPGAHTFGVRAVAQGGSNAVYLGLTSVMLMKVSGVANSAAGVNAYGDW
jgi:hypothetical protein